MFPPQRLEASDLEHPNHQAGTLARDNRIAMAQYECFQRITKESHRKTLSTGKTRWKYWCSKLHYPDFSCVCVCVPAGLECNTTWDGWLCWDQTEAGVTTEQGCPDYFHDFDPNGNITSWNYDCASFAKHAKLVAFFIYPQRWHLKYAQKRVNGGFTLTATAPGPTSPSAKPTTASTR